VKEWSYERNPRRRAVFDRAVARSEADLLLNAEAATTRSVISATTAACRQASATTRNPGNRLLHAMAGIRKARLYRRGRGQAIQKFKLTSDA